MKMLKNDDFSLIFPCSWCDAFVFLVLSTFEYIMALLRFKLANFMIATLNIYLCSFISHLVLRSFPCMWYCNDGGSKREGTCVFWLCVEGKGGNYVNQNARWCVVYEKCFLECEQCHLLKLYFTLNFLYGEIDSEII
jgi:hypothetical protein